MAAARRDDGFTLIELLVVIIIIGVLASIAIPTFLGQRQKGYKAAMVSDLRALVITQDGRSADGGTYTSSVDALRADGFQTSEGVDDVTVVLFDNGTPQYTACVRHVSLDQWLVYSSVTGVTTYSLLECDAPPST